MFVIKPNKFRFILPEGYFYSGTRLERGTKPPRIPSDSLMFVNPTLVRRYYNLTNGGTLDTLIEGQVLSDRIAPISRDYLPLGVFLTGVFFKKNPKRSLFYESNIFFPARNFNIDEIGESGKINRRAWVGFSLMESWDQVENNGSFTEYQRPNRLEEAVAKLSTKCATIKYARFPSGRLFQAASECVGPVGSMTRIVFSHLTTAANDQKLNNRKRIITNMFGRENLSGLVRVINHANSSIDNTIGLTLVSNLNEAAEIALTRRFG